MATPIRWDNVQGPSFRDSQAGLESAARSFQAGLAALNQPIEQAQAIDASNAVVKRNNNTNAFLDTIAQYSNADALQKAQQDGSIAALRANFGNNIDAGAVRGAADARLAAIQNQAKTKIEYDNAMRNEATAPALDRLNSAITNQDADAERQARNDLSQLGFRNYAAVDAFADQRRRELVERGQKDQNFNLGQRKGTQEIEASKANVDINRGQLGVAQAAQRNQAAQTQSNILMNNFNMDRQTAIDNSAKRAGAAAAAKTGLREVGNMYAGGVWDGTQADEINQGLVKNGQGNPEQRAKLINKINELQKDGIAIVDDNGVAIKDAKGNKIVIHDLPLGAVQQAAAGAYNPLLSGWNSGYAETFEDNLKKILKSTIVVDNKATSKAKDDLSAFQKAISKAMEDAPGILPNRPRPTR